MRSDVHELAGDEDRSCNADADGPRLTGLMPNCIIYRLLKKSVREETQWSGTDVGCSSNLEMPISADDFLCRENGSGFASLTELNQPTTTNAPPILAPLQICCETGLTNCATALVSA